MVFLRGELELRNARFLLLLGSDEADVLEGLFEVRHVLTAFFGPKVLDPGAELGTSVRTVRVLHATHDLAVGDTYSTKIIKEC